MRQTGNAGRGAASAGTAEAVRAPGAAGLDGAVDLVRDRELVERCQSGDQSAFGELYDRYHRRLFRFCLRRLQNPNDAEEAVQEAFTRAWRALPRFGGERRFYPWLSVIAGNVCTDVLRRRSRLVPMEDLPLPAGVSYDDDVDAALLRQVDLAMATEALGHLSERHQRVLRLREASGWSTQRIAEQEGVAVPAVDTLLWRARQAFKREFVALTESSGRFAAAVGAGVLALRRFGLRHTARAAARLPLPGALSSVRPGTLLASAAVTGAAIAGGTLVAVDSGHHAPPALPAATVAAGRPVVAPSAGSSAGSSTGAHGTSTTAPASGSAAPNGTSASRAGVLPPVAAATGGNGSTATTMNPVGAAIGGTSTGGAATTGGAVGGVVGGVGNTAGGVVNGVVGTVNGLTTPLGLPLTGSSSTSTTSQGVVGSVGGTVGSAVTGVGQVLSGLGGSSSTPSGTGSTGGTGGAGGSTTAGLGGVLGG